MVNGQTFTTIQDGDWSSASTWDANGVPPINLSSDVVIINHRITNSNTIKLLGNSTLTINHILSFDSGSLEIETTTDVLNINYGMLIVKNGLVLNKAGIVNFNYGRIQLCNDNYKDESNSPQGTFGTGTIFAENGNIEDINSGNFSSSIEWCSANGGSLNLPIPENCALVEPPASDCDDETYYIQVICSLNPPSFADTDTDGVLDFCDNDDDNDGVTDVIEQDGNLMRDTDNDGLEDIIDIDSDADGIPDNVETQLTIGYIAPSGAVDAQTGILNVYGTGLIPIDTDNDGVADIIDTDTDNDGLLDIEENGMSNVLLNSDTDNDGLDDAFEGANLNDAIDVNDEINNPSSSILPDTDADLGSGGDLDYRDLFDINPPSFATLDFDGIDDYLSASTFIDGKDEVSIMAWVKIASGNAVVTTIAGEDISCKLYIENNDEPSFSIKVQGESTKIVSANAIAINEWHHITGSYSNVTGILRIYVDGIQEDELDTGVTGAKIEVTSDSNGAFEVGRISSNVPDREYFKGAIDEVRVFDISLTADQIQRMIYQEIENYSSNVRGTVIEKDIVDIISGNTISWASLIAYYPMTDIKNSTTTDYSVNSNTLQLNNITSFEEQTAPMPYKTISNGNWTDESTWFYGSVWDIEDVNNNKDWSIVKIQDDVSTSSSHKALGLIIDSSKKLTVTGDNLIQNSWYLELNGTLDLEDDSQLVQTENSDLVSSSTGKILRRQEGCSNVYWYNYWSSPVGTTMTTTLIDNNTTLNNSNNTTFSLNMLKEGNTNSVQFTSAYDEVGKISTRWLYTYINGLTYYDWAVLNSTDALEPGIGYTQKGIGNPGLEQQYIYEGKPNNGTIVINVTDTGGAGSVPSVSKTDFFLGNPYPSALDINKFIDDNVGVIDGTLQLWQQWSGNSHVLDEYNGGYAQVNKLGAVRAYQFVGLEGSTNESQDGTKIPSRYLPVGQGFMTEIISDGTIVFKNSQRVFVKEADADGNYNNGSVFFRLSNSESDERVFEDNVMQKIRIELNAVNGPPTKRELLLGFSDVTTDGFDYGYDAKNTDENSSDLNLLLENELMLIQAYAPITLDKVIPLSFKSSGDFNYEIKATEFENIATEQDVYLRDHYTGSYFDLKSDGAYGFNTEMGLFNERFDIVFQSEESLSIETLSHNTNLMYYNNATKKLFVKNLNTSVTRLVLINTLGQTVQEYMDVSAQTLENGLEISNLSSGIYVVYFKTGSAIQTKKIIID
ncbi:hypothetical protein A9Q86_14320 [Flavobacteriales bacterium 33_180_T64]|nr:hypothetical protein A9Q86_14320 [Flavobacteriales bacterium 33_180_T64]